MVGTSLPTVACRWISPEGHTCPWVVQGWEIAAFVEKTFVNFLSLANPENGDPNAGMFILLV
jgi:hypothetical protein